MAAFQYLLDTDIASYGMHQRNEILDSRLRFASAGNLFLSAISAAELLYGSKSFASSDPRRSRIRHFLANANVLPWDLAAAEAYADIRQSLTIRSQLIGELDMMIAAHALSAGLVLVSNNTRHFERLAPPLRLENWTEA